MIETSRDARFFRQVAHLETSRQVIADESQRYSFAEWMQDLALSFSYNGTAYTTPIMQTQNGSKQERPSSEFAPFTERLFKRNGPVFGVMAARGLLLSETVFKFRNLATKELFGSEALSILEEPWPNGTTGELLAGADQHVSLAGNWFVYDGGDRLYVLNPTWTGIMLASDEDAETPDEAWDARVAGYVYKPPKGKARLFTPDEIVHWSPTPDPSARFRGMSWLQPIVSEILGDQALTEHKLTYMENAATPNMVVKFPESLVDPEQYRKIREAMSNSEGPSNAGKNLYLMAGADVTVVGANLQQLDVKAIQGAYETRVCVAGRVPAVVAGVSEGMQGSSLNAGNFGQAKRLMADGWYHPTVKSLCAAVAPLVTVPTGSQLWYDPSDVAMLREDLKDIAETSSTDAQMMRTLVEAGFDPASVIAYAQSRDPKDLRHTGNLSVQLQPPGAQTQQETP